MTAFVSKRVTVDAVQWTGSNLADVQAFAGDDFIGAGSDGHLWVRNAAGPFEIHPGYWMSRQPGMPLILHSPAAWDRLFEAAP